MTLEAKSSIPIDNWMTEFTYMKLNEH